MRAAFLVAILTLSALLAFAVSEGTRGMLWHAVQACVFDHQFVGLSWPCLRVQKDIAPSYVVLRGPFDRSHVVVSPATKLIGIEAPELRIRNATGYLDAAWHSRSYVTADLSANLDQTDIGLAINSRFGRTQDQLHVHVDCLRRSVKNKISQAVASKMYDQAQIAFFENERPYLLIFLGDHLAGSNVVALAASGLQLSEADVDRLTIAIAASSDRQKNPGFILLAQAARPNKTDDGHAEELLDHDCRETAVQIGLRAAAR